VAEIDAGHPPIAGLVFGTGMGHAVVLAGYAEPDLVVVQDPWGGTGLAQFNQFRRSRGHAWYMTWELTPTDRTVFDVGSDTAPLAQVTSGPAKATVKTTVPTMRPGPKLEQVEKRIQRESASLRACYEQGMKESPPVAPTAVATVSFGLDHGNPIWLRVKE